MENVGRDMLVISSDKFAGVFIQHNQAGGIRRSNALVSIIDAGSGVQVEVVTIDEDRAMGRVVRPNTGPGGQIEKPKYIGVERAGSKSWRDIVRRHVSAFGQERAV